LYQIILGIAGAIVGSYFLDGEIQTELGLPEFLSRVIEAFIGVAIILLAVLLFKKVTSK
jgi:uncharacterized membrane protein YeaQ/YmgE (transglycosylase-associated protein family)